MSKRIWKQRGDVYWVNNEYHIGSSNSRISGGVGTMCEKALSLLLDKENIGREITYEEIAQVTGSCNPHNLMSGLVCQMRHSKIYMLLRRDKKIRLNERV